MTTATPSFVRPRFVLLLRDSVSESCGLCDEVKISMLSEENGYSSVRSG